MTTVTVLVGWLKSFTNVLESEVASALRDPTVEPWRDAIKIYEKRFSIVLIVIVTLLIPITLVLFPLPRIVPGGQPDGVPLEASFLVAAALMLGGMTIWLLVRGYGRTRAGREYLDAVLWAFLAAVLIVMLVR